MAIWLCQSFPHAESKDLSSVSKRMRPNQRTLFYGNPNLPTGSYHIFFGPLSQFRGPVLVSTPRLHLFSLSSSESFPSSTSSKSLKRAMPYCRHGVRIYKKLIVRGHDSNLTNKGFWVLLQRCVASSLQAITKVAKSWSTVQAQFQILSHGHATRLLC
jgi:hypothetical protein